MRVLLQVTDAEVYNYPNWETLRDQAVNQVMGAYAETVTWETKFTTTANYIIYLYAYRTPSAETTAKLVAQGKQVVWGNVLTNTLQNKTLPASAWITSALVGKAGSSPCQSLG